MSRGGIDSLLNVSRSALFAQTQAIRVISDNIANVNTPGYSRRKAEMVSQALGGAAGYSIGTGVNVNKIVRVTDKFINASLIDRTSDRASAATRNEILLRAEAPFAVDGTVTIGAQMAEFFAALDDLASNPSDIGLRQNVLERGNNLAQAINQSYDQIAGLQREANDRIGVMVQEVNRITTDIAQINVDIQKAEITDQEALALRDQRDQLLRDLAEHVSFDTVETNDGSILVTLSNGFSLVDPSGSRNLEFTTNPSFAPVGGYPPGMDGLAMGHIVFDFDPTATNAHVDLTQIVAAGGGDIGGLLRVRGVQQATDTSPFDAAGELVGLGARVDAMARDLLTRFNTTYLGPDENPGLAGHQASSGDLNGNQPGVFGLFTFAGAVDADGDGLPEATDLAATGNHSFANLLQFNVSDPANFAAALDSNPVAGATAFAPGDGQNISALLALRDQSVAYSVGNFSANQTIEGLYDTTVTAAGSLAATAKNNFDAAVAREDQLFALQQNVSGVSLDEEFGNLINFQRAYEGSARMIRVADEMYREIIALLG